VEGEVRAGVIEARGSKGQQALTAKRETTGPAARIVLRPDRARIAADGEDVSMVTVEVVDAQGRVVPVAANEVSFKVSGSGRLLGVSNGDLAATSPTGATAQGVQRAGDGHRAGREAGGRDASGSVLAGLRKRYGGGGVRGG